MKYELVFTKALRECKPKREKEVRATPGLGDFYSQIFKTITTALRLVTMKGIACTIERVER